MYIYPCEEPKKKLVPFDWEDRELLRGKWLKHKIRNDEECSIIGFQLTKSNYDEMLLVIVFNGVEIEKMSAYDLLEEYTFLDGSPCGKEIEEWKVIFCVEKINDWL